MDPAPVADRPHAEPATGSVDTVDACPADHRALVAAAAAEADLASAGGCPVPHVATVVAPAESVAPDVNGCPVPHSAAPALALDAEPAAAAGAARCPIPHIAAAAPATSGCPVPHGATVVGAPQRSAADHVMRKLLRIKERPAGVTQASAYSAFQKSMLISATRCTLTYLIVPFFLPAVVGGVGPLVGVLLGTFAMVCDTYTIRRFFAVDHKWRWHFTILVLAVMGLLAVLWVQDVSHLVSDLLA